MILRILNRDESATNEPARPSLAEALTGERLLTRILLLTDGRLVLETCDWDRFWGAAASALPAPIKAALEELRTAWADYISSGFIQDNFGPYAEAQARLRALLTDAPAGCAAHAVRTRLAEFEQFEVVDLTGGRRVGIGRSALRAPGPAAEPADTHDCSFEAAPGHEVVLKPEPVPAAGEACRQLAARFREQMERAQPRSRVTVRARAQSRALADDVILPCLEDHIAANRGAPQIELVDVSVGRGNLLARLCQHLDRALKPRGIEANFRLWMLEPGTLEPRTDLRQLTDMLHIFKVDYELCVPGRGALPPASGPRFAVVTATAEAAAATELANPAPPALVCAAAAGEGAVQAQSHGLRLYSAGANAYDDGESEAQGQAALTVAEAEEAYLPRPAAVTAEPPAEEPTDERLRVLETLVSGCDAVVVQASDVEAEDLIRGRGELTSAVALDLTEDASSPARLVLFREAETADALAGRRLW